MGWREQMAWRKRLVKVERERDETIEYLTDGGWFEEDVAYSMERAKEILSRMGFDPYAELHRMELIAAVGK